MQRSWHSIWNNKPLGLIWELPTKISSSFCLTLRRWCLVIDIDAIRTNCRRRGPSHPSQVSIAELHRLIHPISDKTPILPWWEPQSKYRKCLSNKLLIARKMLWNKNRKRGSNRPFGQLKFKLKRSPLHPNSEGMKQVSPWLRRFWAHLLTNRLFLGQETHRHLLASLVNGTQIHRMGNDVGTTQHMLARIAQRSQLVNFEI